MTAENFKTFVEECVVQMEQLHQQHHSTVDSLNSNYLMMEQQKDEHRYRAEMAEGVVGAKQTEIDRLMLEFCPEEMPKEQMEFYKKLLNTKS